MIATSHVVIAVPVSGFAHPLACRIAMPSQKLEVCSRLSSSGEHQQAVSPQDPDRQVLMNREACLPGQHDDFLDSPADALTAVQG